MLTPARTRLAALLVLALPLNAWAAGTGAEARLRALLSADTQLVEEGADLRTHIDRRLDGLDVIVLQQHLAGLPVVDAWVAARYRADELLFLRHDTAPVRPLVGTRATRAAALSTLRAALPLKPGATLEVQASEEVVWAGEDLQDLPRHAWKVRVLADREATHHEVAPYGGWWDAVVVDGQVVRIDSLLRDAGVHLESHVRNPTGPEGDEISPIVGATVRYADGGEELTDLDGTFPADGGEVTLDLTSSSLRVRTETGVAWDGLLGPVEQDEDIVLDLRDVDIEQHAQLTAWVYSRRAVAMGRLTLPEVTSFGGRLEVLVNIDDSCNAYFNGGMNFMTAGQGCENTALLYDVVLHEYGHGLHLFGLVDGMGAFDGSLSEGVSDFFSAWVTDSPDMAPGFFENNSPLRQLANEASWPDDVVGGDVHTTGLIIGGALWDLHIRLHDTYDWAEAQERSGSALAAVIRYAADIPSSREPVIEALPEDVCMINEAFALHGLAPEGGPAGVDTFHEPAGVYAPDAPIDIEAFFEVAYPQCLEAPPEALELQYSVDGSDWEVAELIELADLPEVAVSLPPQAAGSHVRYRFTLRDGNGEALRSLPDNPGEPYFQAYVGELPTVWSDSFDTDLLGRGGWSGGGDWSLGRPSGEAADPSEAFSEPWIFGTDLGTAARDGFCTAGDESHLYSPPIAVPNSALRLQFRRWLELAEGSSAWITANGQRVWEADEERRHRDASWAFVDLELAAVGRELTLGFHMACDDRARSSGWNIDSVTVLQDGEGSGCAASQAPGRRSLPAAWGLLMGALWLTTRRRER